LLTAEVIDRPLLLLLALLLLLLAPEVVLRLTGAGPEAGGHKGQAKDVEPAMWAEEHDSSPSQGE
jgi:hypothetical protein